MIILNVVSLVWRNFCVHLNYANLCRPRVTKRHNFHVSNVNMMFYLMYDALSLCLLWARLINHTQLESRILSWRCCFSGYFSTNLMIEDPWMLIWIARIMQNWKWKLQNWWLGSFSVNKSALASPVELPDQTGFFLVFFLNNKNKQNVTTFIKAAFLQLQGRISIPALILNELRDWPSCYRAIVEEPLSISERALHVHNLCESIADMWRYRPIKIEVLQMRPLTTRGRQSPTQLMIFVFILLQQPSPDS